MKRYELVKRAFDIVGSSVVLVLAGPLMFLIAAAIRLTPGPVLYRGVRVGRGGVDFEMLKFRTMTPDIGGATSTSADDPRITRLGAFLRAYKLDELPQFINVLRGEMSIIGPRPQVRWAVNLYTPEQTALLDIRPGITDFASLFYRNEGEILRGSADPDKDYLERIAPGKLKLALLYRYSMSPSLDAKILVATALALLGTDPTWCIPQNQRPQDPTISEIAV